MKGLPRSFQHLCAHLHAWTDGLAIDPTIVIFFDIIRNEKDFTLRTFGMLKEFEPDHAITHGIIFAGVLVPGWQLGLDSRARIDSALFFDRRIGPNANAILSQNSIKRRPDGIIGSRCREIY